MRGQGCIFCGGKLKLSTQEFINRAQKLYNDRYDYSLVKYTAMRSKVLIICNNCKKVFNQTPYKHLTGCGCPYCKKSRGELTINQWLTTNHIDFEIQKRFKDCKDKKPLPFDFYIPNNNICIEFQGAQHYLIDCFIHRFKNDLIKAQKNFTILQNHDKIKKKFCEENRIFLYEITYKDNIEEKLKTLFEHYIK